MKVITLEENSFFEKCIELTSKLDLQPDLIVGILNGGGHIVDNIKSQSNFEPNIFQFVKVQRETTLKNYAIIDFFLKSLPYSVLNVIRIFESFLVRKSIENLNKETLSLREIDFKFSLNTKKDIKTILIIDDAIDTGKTMFTVKNNLSKMFSGAEIKTAVIAWTIDTSIEKPDYYLFKNVLIRFPWSKDYKIKKFEEKSFSS